MKRSIHPTGEVHAVAAMFPMMSEDELDDLAADIQQYGLVHPIVLDRDGVLIDGRNRLEACRRADVEPRYETFDGDDPASFILSNNVARRHLSKGQQAMAVAKAWTLTRNLSLRELADSTQQNRERVRQAAVVLEWAPELADQVMAGYSLDQAYEIARERKEAPEKQAAMLARLQQQWADEAEQLRQTIDLAIEQIGPEVQIPHEATWPNLEVRPFKSDNGEQRPVVQKPAEVEVLKAQKEYISRLIDVRMKVRGLRQVPSISDAWWPDGHVAAVRSALSQIIADALAIAELHDLPRQPLRKVK